MSISWTKNAYGRHWISQPMLMVAPIPKLTKINIFVFFGRVGGLWVCEFLSFWVTKFPSFVKQLTSGISLSYCQIFVLWHLDKWAPSDDINRKLKPDSSKTSTELFQQTSIGKQTGPFLSTIVDLNSQLKELVYNSSQNHLGFSKSVSQIFYDLY